MAPVTGCKSLIVFWFFVMGIATGKVNISGVWKPNSGWEVTCSWMMNSNDILLSVGLFRNDNQIMGFRPGIHGNSYSIEVPNSEYYMKIKCHLTVSQAQGTCTINVELLAPIGEDQYMCKTSGERPLFREENSTVFLAVPPSDAEVSWWGENSTERRTLRCTSRGIPAPRLLWTVREQRIPEDFTEKIWNKTTKLWHTWSSHKPQSDGQVTCSPEVVTTAQTYRGNATLFDVNSAKRIGLNPILVSSFIVFNLVR